MNAEETHKLAQQLAAATGLDLGVAERALESDDRTIVEMAKTVVDLDATRADWHADMAEHRAKLRAV